MGFFISVWVIRYLGPHDFGILSFVQSIVGVFAVFANLSMQGIIVKDLVELNGGGRSYIASALLLRVVASSITVFLLWSGAFLFFDGITQNILLIVSVSIFFQSFNIFDFFFQYKVLSKYVVFSNVISLAISSLLKIYFMMNSYSLIYISFCFLLDAIIFSIFLFLFFIKLEKGKIFRWQLDINISINVFKKSLPLVPTAFVILAYMKVDSIMLGSILDKDAVGYYSAAIKLIEPLSFIPLVLVNSLYPKLIELKNTNQDRFKEKVEWMFSFVFIYALVCCIIFLLFSDYFVNLLYGDKYKVTSSIIIISIFNLIFVGWRYISGRLFIINNSIKIYFYTSILGLFLNIVLNYLFIREFGVLGASYATLLSFIFSTYLVYFLFDETKYIFSLQTKILFFFGWVRK